MKAKRQAEILRIITEQDVETQEEMLEKMDHMENWVRVITE